MPTPAAPNWRRPETATAGTSSLGLTTRQASLLAYSAGWISGLVLLTLEARDRDVRLHAAQSFLGFGVLTLVGATLLALAGISLFWSLTMFRVCLWLVQGVVAAGLVLWAWSLFLLATGRSPHWPIVGRRAQRLANP